MSPIDQEAIEPELQALLSDINEANDNISTSEALLLAAQGQLAFQAGILGSLARVEILLSETLLLAQETS